MNALKQRAVVMWRTHADTMPDEAGALSVLALADCMMRPSRPGWNGLCFSTSSVRSSRCPRTGSLDLATWRLARGQVIMITQSVADVESLTGQTGLLASLTDNFAGVVAHRQTSPESRDWLAKLMGTRALWQSTSQTGGHGQHTGRGSARRVREFRISSDTFGSLGSGEAVIYTPIAGEPARGRISAFRLRKRSPTRIDATGMRTDLEISVNGSVGRGLAADDPRAVSDPSNGIFHA